LSLAVGGIGQPQVVQAGVAHAHGVLLDEDAVHLDGADVDQHAVLEPRGDVELPRGAGTEHDLGSEEARLRDDGRRRAGESAHHDASGAAGDVDDVRPVMLETAVDVLGVFGQHDPRAGRRAGSPSAWWCR